MTPHLVTVARAATLVGRSSKTIRRWIHDGSLAAVPARGGYRVPVPALFALARPSDTPNLTVVSHSRTPLDTAENADGYDAGEGSTRSPTPEVNMSVDLSQFLTLRDAAKQVGRSTRTLRRWVSQGDIPGALTLKGRLLIPPGDLDRMFRPRGRVVVGDA